MQSHLDLDTDLESTGVEHLVKTGRHPGDTRDQDRGKREPVILVSHDGFNQTLGWRCSIVVTRPVCRRGASPSAIRTCARRTALFRRSDQCEEAVGEAASPA
jgi:hypothetical protein